MHVQHVFFLGNRKKGVRWLSWAKTKLKDLQRYHPGFDGASFGVKRYSLEAGEDGFIEVLIKMVKGQEWIIIWAEETPSIYMESGILDHRNIAPLNEDTYLPSILHYGDDIKAIRGKFAELGKLRVKEVSTNQLDGENLGEGDSNSVGCPKEEKLIEITATTEFGAETFTAQKPIYCAPSRIYSVKNVQSRMPPSMFSGKLRLFVQALYGSKRDDYALDPSLEELGPLKINNANLNWTYNGNTALFSGRNHEYFLLQVFSSGLWARPMATTEAGEALRKYLNDNPGIPTERKKRYETYLLSTLYVSSESSWVKIKDDVGDAYSKGAPWYYGWSWNMDGTEARAVTIQLKPGTDNEWQSTMFRLSVSERDLAETLEEGRLTASFVTIEDTQDFTGRTNGDLIWWPHDLSAGMRPWIPAPLFVTPPSYDFDVPIYTVADYEGGGFDVVRYKREDKSSVGLGGSLGNCSNRATPRCGTYACGYHSVVGGSTLEVGFYVDGLSEWKAVGLDAQNVTLCGNEAAVDRPGNTLIATGNGVTTSSFHNYNRLGNCGNDPGGSNVGNWEWYESPTFGGQANLSGDIEWESMLIVPYYDCESFYLGRWHTFSGDVSSGHTQPGSTVDSTVTLYDHDGNILVQDAELQVNYGDTSTPTSGYEIVGEANQQGKWVSFSTKETDWHEVEVRLFINGSNETVYEQNVVGNAEVAEKLFIPTCMRSVVFGEETPQMTPGDSVPDYEQGSVSTGGFEFDPVLFNLPPFGFETGPRVESQMSANFLSYRATEQPTDKYIESGGYDFDKNNISGLWSFVGFA